MVSVKTYAAFALTGASILAILIFRNQITGAAFALGKIGGDVLTLPFEGFISSFKAFQQDTASFFNPAGAPGVISDGSNTPASKSFAQMLGGAAGTVAVGAGVKAIVGSGAVDSLLSPNTGAKTITTDVLQNYFDQLNTSYPKAVQDIPGIGGNLLDYLQAGGKSIADFAANYRFPSGQSLTEIIGGGGRGIIPEAVGQVQTDQLQGNALALYNLNKVYNLNAQGCYVDPYNANRIIPLSSDSVSYYINTLHKTLKQASCVGVQV